MTSGPSAQAGWLKPVARLHHEPRLSPLSRRDCPSCILGKGWAKAAEKTEQWLPRGGPARRKQMQDPCRNECANIRISLHSHPLPVDRLQASVSAVPVLRLCRHRKRQAAVWSVHFREHSREWEVPSVFAVRSPGSVRSPRCPLADSAGHRLRAADHRQEPSAQLQRDLRFGRARITYRRSPPLLFDKWCIVAPSINRVPAARPTSCGSSWPAGSPKRSVIASPQPDGGAEG